MGAEQVRNMLTGKPFHPFEVRTSSGEGYKIGHPESVWVSPDDKVVLIYDKAEGVVLIDSDHVAECVRRVVRKRKTD